MVINADEEEWKLLRPNSKQVGYFKYIGFKIFNNLKQDIIVEQQQMILHFCFGNETQVTSKNDKIA
jgi:hypothetical protein